MTRLPTTMSLLAGIVVLSTLLTGCPEQAEFDETVAIWRLTGAPPARSAQLIPASRYTETPRPGYIELSHGVVMAVRCSETCDNQCAGVQFLSSNADVIEVHPTFVLNSNVSNAYVLVGKKPGATRLTVSTSCATEHYDVTVLDDHDSGTTSSTN